MYCMVFLPVPKCLCAFVGFATQLHLTNRFEINRLILARQLRIGGCRYL